MIIPKGIICWVYNFVYVWWVGILPAQIQTIANVKSQLINKHILNLKFRPIDKLWEVRSETKSHIIFSNWLYGMYYAFIDYSHTGANIHQINNIIFKFDFKCYNDASESSLNVCYDLFVWLVTLQSVLCKCLFITWKRFIWAFRVCHLNLFSFEIPCARSLSMLFLR